MSNVSVFNKVKIKEAAGKQIVTRALEKFAQQASAKSGKPVDNVLCLSLKAGDYVPAVFRPILGLNLSHDGHIPSKAAGSSGWGQCNWSETAPWSDSWCDHWSDAGGSIEIDKGELVTIPGVFALNPVTKKLVTAKMSDFSPAELEALTKFNISK